MKKTLLAVAVAAALPAAAFAQTNVTLYGITDAGVGITDTDAPVGKSRSTVVNSGYNSGSRWGLRGQEDLGGGLKAIFNIESGFDIDTGASKNRSTTDTQGHLFNRRAVVGLAGGWGEVRIGRDYSTGFSAAGVNDVMGYGLYGNWGNYTVGGGGIATRINNGIYYTSPAFGNTKCMAVPAPTECAAFGGGLTVTAFYSTAHGNLSGAPVKFAETPENKDDAYGVAAAYRGGPLSASLYYQELNSNATGNPTKKEMGVGGGWNFGIARVAINYGTTEGFDGVDTDGVGLGVGLKIGAGELLGQVIQIKRDAVTGTDPKATIWGLAYLYPLSKRTNLYATYGTARNNSAGQFTLFSADNAVSAANPGSDPSGFAVGVRHMF